jgi:hypothetical protein
VARAAEPPGEAGPCIPNAEVPPYIGRDAETDQRLMDKFDQGGLAIIVGPASAGKTRLAYEAARRHAGGRLLLFPSDPQALKRLRDAARPKDRLANAVVWLDQINTYVTEGGLNGAILNFLCPEEVTDIILLGTLRREDYNALTAGTGLTPEIMQAARDVLDHAAIIHLSTELTDDERIRAEAQRADPRIAAALDQRNGAGFAPYLAAAPWALDRWLANAESPAGKLVTAAIDARLAGFQAPLTPSILKELHAVYVTSPNFDDALAWCLEPVRGASGCLIPEPGAAPAYRPFTYLLDYAQSHRMPPIPDDAWLVLPAHPTYIRWPLPPNARERQTSKTRQRAEPRKSLTAACSLSRRSENPAMLWMLLSPGQRMKHIRAVKRMKSSPGSEAMRNNIRWPRITINLLPSVGMPRLGAV